MKIRNMRVPENDISVVCISDDIKHRYITKGKTYVVYRETDDKYELKNDRTWIGLFQKEYFKDIIKIREEKLNELGI